MVNTSRTTQSSSFAKQSPNLKILLHYQFYLSMFDNRSKYLHLLCTCLVQFSELFECLLAITFPHLPGFSTFVSCSGQKLQSTKFMNSHQTQ